MDACEFARYAPDAGHEAMDAHYQEALKVISSIDAKMKHKSVTPSRTLSVIIFLLSGTLAFSIPIRAAEAAPLPEEHNPSYTATRGEAAASNRHLGEATVSDKQLWEEATAAYQEGRWSDAVTAYEAILATGRTAPELQYNLGNAWFKAGEPARAILCYERALKLDPSYDDARYNLEFAREQTQDRIDVVPEFIIERWGRSACYLLDSDTWTVLFFVFAAVFAVLLLAFLLSARTSWKRVGFYGGIVVLLLALLCLDFAHWQLADYRKADSAIVMRPVCSAKSSPSEASAKDLFVLHEGTKVKILDEVGGWKNIELSDGRTGWVPAADIEVI
jgi:tetratricopeptide (TPR) repeat protein